MLRSSVSKSGLLVVFLILIFALWIPFAAAAPQAQGCYGDPQCYEEPPPSGEQLSVPSNEPAWGGYSDGRLNPDQAEYYSIWCENDFIDVWRGVPDGLWLKSIPILDVFLLEEGGVLDLGDTMTLIRNTADTITIYGSNGNLAPTPGQKAFSLSECIARNGGVPESEEQVNPPPSNESPSNEDLTTICFELTGEDLLDCLASQPELSGLQTLWLWIAQFCLPAASVVVFIPAGMYRLRRKR